MHAITGCGQDLWGDMHHPSHGKPALAAFIAVLLVWYSFAEMQGKVLANGGDRNVRGGVRHNLLASAGEAQLAWFVKDNTFSGILWDCGPHFGQVHGRMSLVLVEMGGSGFDGDSFIQYCTTAGSVGVMLPK